MEATAQTSKPGVPLKIGFSRDVPQLRTLSQASALMAWTGVSGGQIAAISVTSPEALGVRLGLLVEKLPTTAQLRFYAQGADQVFEVSGQEIMETIARNMAAGDKTDEGRTYWSPVIDGQEITVEIELPTGVSTNEVMISIPRVSHLFSSPLNTSALQEQIGEAASCNLDSMCYQASWGSQSLATAKMAFTSGGGSYVCTGTLMNDQASDYIPYFLSANHCISAQTEASSLQTYWFYRSSSCNSGSLSPSMQTLTSGATLLYASSATDTSFMRLNSAPPGGTSYAGWTTSLQALSTSVAGIHNPRGDLQKISFGTITGYDNCVSNGGGTFTCTSASAGSATFLEVVNSQGITEGGSSGSGLWTASGSSHYLTGQLYGSSNSCAAPSSPAFYGSFGVAYNAALYQWLGSGTNYALSVSKTGTGSGTVTSSPAGISCGATCSAGFSSGTSVTLLASPAAGSNFTGWSGACTGTGSCIVSMSAARSVAAAFDAVGTAVSLSPTSLSFAAQAVGTTSVAKTVTLTNTGGAVLNIASILVYGNFDGTTTCGATLAQAASCIMNITFTPSAASSYLGSVVIASNAASSPNTISLSGTGTAVATVPVCSLTANPASIFAGGSSKLTASCTPAATSYVWTGGTCVSQSTNSCTVTPAATTSYTVKGVNGAGTGTSVSANVTVALAPPIFSGGLYDGIYQWTPGVYLTIQQHGANIIATNYFNVDGSFTFTSSDGHVLPVPQLDIFDLYNGSVSGANANISGTEFHRACNVSYSLVFSDNGSITVTKTAVSNTAAATQVGISCAAITEPIGTVKVVPKILF